jgi:hypothetical protein
MLRRQRRSRVDEAHRETIVHFASDTRTLGSVAPYERNLDRRSVAAHVDGRWPEARVDGVGVDIESTWMIGAS